MHYSTAVFHQSENEVLWLWQLDAYATVTQFVRGLTNFNRLWQWFKSTNFLKEKERPCSHSRSR